MSIGSTLTNSIHNGANAFGTAASMGANSVAASGASLSMTGDNSSILSDAQRSANDSVATQAQLAAIQSDAATKTAAINMQLTQTMSAIHFAQDTAQAEAKVANAGADGAKEAA